MAFVDLVLLFGFVIVVLFALIAGAILYIVNKWRKEEVDEEAARRLICFIKARPKLVKKWIEQVSEGKVPGQEEDE